MLVYSLFIYIYPCHLLYVAARAGIEKEAAKAALKQGGQGVADKGANSNASGNKATPSKKEKKKDKKGKAVKGEPEGDPIYGGHSMHVLVVGWCVCWCSVCVCVRVFVRTTPLALTFNLVFGIFQCASLERVISSLVRRRSLWDKY